jgi:hypothetical protein
LYFSPFSEPNDEYRMLRGDDDDDDDDDDDVKGGEEQAGE